MMQKVKSVVILSIILLVFFSINTMAMPPHPDYLKKLVNQGEMQKMISKLNAQRAKGIDNSIKTFPTTSDNANVLVLLIGFRDLKFDKATSANNFILPISKRKIKIPFDTLPIFLFSIVIISALFIGNKRLRKKLFLVATSMLFFFALTACPNPVNIDYFNTDQTKFYDNLFENGSFSWKQYYLDMSNNKLNLSFDVVGPFSASQGYTYYGSNDSQGSDLHPAELVGVAIDQAEKAGVDFSKYDNDHDGKADAVVVIHAGPGEEIMGNFGGTYFIWSHRWNLSNAKYFGDGTGPRHYDGVTIDDYTIQPEYNIQPGDSSIGVFCHEFGHILGLPDLYDYQYEASGLGLFSLMDSGAYGGPNFDGSRPIPLTAWERSVLGWLNFTTLNVGNTISNFDVYNSLSSSRNALKVQLVKDSTKDQYLFLEYLYKQAGTWSEYLPGSGLLVLRIDQKLVDDGINSPNSYNFNDFKDLHHGVEVVEADNQWELWDLSLNNSAIFGEQEDLFTTVADEILSSLTNPNTNYYPGTGNYGHTPTLSSGVIMDIKAITEGTSITVTIRN